MKRETASNEPSIQGGTEHILLVDDEHMIVDLEKNMLERLGYKVTAQCGRCWIKTDKRIKITNNASFGKISNLPCIILFRCLALYFDSRSKAPCFYV